MHVDERPGRDVLRGEADDLPVLSYRLTQRDVGQGDLMPQADRLADRDGAPAGFECKSARQRPGGHRDRVIAPQDNGLGALEDNAHHNSPGCKNDRFSWVFRYQQFIRYDGR